MNEYEWQFSVKTGKKQAHLLTTNGPIYLTHSGKLV